MLQQINTRLGGIEARVKTQDGSSTDAHGQCCSLGRCPIGLPPWNRPGNWGAASLLQRGCTRHYWCVPFSSLQAFLKLYYRDLCLSRIGITSRPAAPRCKCKPTKGTVFSFLGYSLLHVIFSRVRGITNEIHHHHHLVCMPYSWRKSALAAATQ